MSMLQSILVTGASGYIGSHIVLVLLEAGYDVIALENSNSSQLQKVQKLASRDFKKIKCNLLKIGDIQTVFSNNNIDVVLHLAAAKGINATTQEPKYFYRCNILGLINLMEVMQEFSVKKLIFASSCAVYGDQKILPVSEHVTPNPQNIYAKTKFFAEEYLRDLSAFDRSLSIIILRYFNPVGAHSKMLGEESRKQQVNIVTLLAKNALGVINNLSISPNCERDFIHVMDLAEAHIKAIQKLNEFEGLKLFNIGSGRGTSLGSLIKTFEDATNTKINFTSKPCADNETKSIYADTQAMEKELNFKPSRSLTHMCEDTWKFVCNEIK